LKTFDTRVALSFRHLDFGMFNLFRRKKPDVQAQTPAVGPQVPVADSLEQANAAEVRTFEAPKVSLRERLSRTVQALTGSLSSLLGAGTKLDEDLFDELEVALVQADVGVTVAARVVKALRSRKAQGEINDVEQLKRGLRRELFDILLPCELSLWIPDAPKPFVLLVVGVNGAGKTTTIGKLAQRLKERGHSVMLAAGDTFRAAAVEQLKTWGERQGVPVIAQGQGADSASVIFDALASAKAKGVDVLIADTAGRLHTQSNLMQELAKVKRVMSKLDETAPHETLLVIDGSQGQNALNQARQFNAAVGLNSVAITKLDGTAKGGIVFAVTDELKLPLRFIGVGEKAEDLREFRASEFLDALLPESLAAEQIG
jgi:fused signal recognition particle receptor